MKGVLAVALPQRLVWIESLAPTSSGDHLRDTVIAAIFGRELD